MLRDFPLFSNMIRNVELAMAKADLTIARLYANLVTDTGNPRADIFDVGSRIRTHPPFILSISGQAELIQGNPVLSRSIRLRNPYVDPMSLVQVRSAPPQAFWHAGRKSQLRLGRYHQRHRCWAAQHG